MGSCSGGGVVLLGGSSSAHCPWPGMPWPCWCCARVPGPAVGGALTPRGGWKLGVHLPPRVLGLPQMLWGLWLWVKQLCEGPSASCRAWLGGEPLIVAGVW